MHTKIYEKIADALVDDGYIIIPKALNTSLIKNLYQFAKNSITYTPAAISHQNQRHQDSTKRNDKTFWIDEDDGIQSQYLHFMHGLRNFLNQSLYLGLHSYEAHFALYEAGDFYEKHLDSFKSSNNRKITTVLYLNDIWREEDGGALVLYDKKNKILETLLPQSGTLLVFLSDTFPHEVKVSHTSRHSIAGWFRTDTQ